MTKKLYETLGVSEDATKEEIERAFRRIAKECHPDRFPVEGEAKEEAKRRWQAAQNAKDILLDPVSRENYDVTGIPQQLMSEEQVIEMAQRQIGFQFNAVIQHNIDQRMQSMRLMMTAFGPQQQIYWQSLPPLESTDFLSEMKKWSIEGRAQLNESLEKARRVLASCRRIHAGLVNKRGARFFHEHLEKEVASMQGNVAQIRNSLRIVDAYERLLGEFTFTLPPDWESDDFDDLAEIDKPTLQLTQERKK